MTAPPPDGSAREPLTALVDLVNQIRKTSPVDDMGHLLTMNMAYIKAVELLDALAAAPQPALDLHPATADLVQRFAIALAEKLAAAEKKYGYRDGWARPDWMDECRAHLAEHVLKGDPRDVAAYCAFLWHHGERTAPQPALKVADGWVMVPREPTPAMLVALWEHRYSMRGQGENTIAKVGYAAMLAAAGAPKEGE